MNNSERVRFVNTLLRRAAWRWARGGTASAVLSYGGQTAEGVRVSSSASITPLKQGVNEKGSSLTKNICVLALPSLLLLCSCAKSDSNSQNETKAHAETSPLKAQPSGSVEVVSKSGV